MTSDRVEPRPPGSRNEEPVSPELEQAIGRVTESIRSDERMRHLGQRVLPDRAAVIDSLDRLMWLVFPGFHGPLAVDDRDLPEHVRVVLGEVSRTLVEQVSGALQYATAERGAVSARARAVQIVMTLMMKIPEIRSTISLDVQAAYDGDPAARHTDEVIACYPGVRALSIHRISHELYRLEVPLIPRMMSEYAHSVTTVDIHPGASIGRSFFIDHGSGVVIGETSRIGDHCKVYQGVTLGAKSFPTDERGRLRRDEKRHPTLEDHVTVYAGATILGGTTVIGAGSVINGGVFLTSSVPPGHVVRGPRFEITLRSNPEMPPGMYSI
jgi:serine O-acetyltransferase